MQDSNKSKEKEPVEVFKYKSFWEMPAVTIFLAILILAIIAYFMIPTRFDDPDYPARAVTTIINLKTIRSAIRLYKLKTGDYPSADLDELYTVHFNDGFKPKTIFEDGIMPYEMITTNEAGRQGNSPNRKVVNVLDGTGGWYYDFSKAKVRVNWDGILDSDWEKYEGENPSNW